MYKILVKKWWERKEQFYGSIYLTLILSYNSSINSNTFYKYAKIFLKYPSYYSIQTWRTVPSINTSEVKNSSCSLLFLCWSATLIRSRISPFYSLYKAFHFKWYRSYFIPCFFHCSSNSSILDLSIKDKPSISLVLTS